MKRKPGKTTTPPAANLLGAVSVCTLAGSFWALVKAVEWSGNVTSHRTPGTAPYKGYESKHWGMGDRLLVFFGFDSDSTTVVSEALLWTSRVGFAVTAILIVLIARILMATKSTG